MTAQAPYESLTTVEAIQKAQADGRTVELNRAPRWEETNLRDEKNIAAFLRIGAEFRAALPERAPVSAGGDAVAWEMSYPKAMDTVSFIVAPEFVRTLERAEYLAAKCLSLYGEAATYRPVVYATPAPPVGADWVVVPRGVTIERTTLRGRDERYIGVPSGNGVTVGNRGDLIERVLFELATHMLAAHAQAGEGSNNA